MSDVTIAPRPDKPSALDLVSRALPLHVHIASAGQHRGVTWTWTTIDGLWSISSPAVTLTGGQARWSAKTPYGDLHWDKCSRGELPTTLLPALTAFGGIESIG